MIYEQYDRIAGEYDDHYTDPKDILENNVIQAMLSRIITPESTVLDIGCGTGLVLDLVEIDPANYIGIDPSQAMLHKLSEKYPEHKVIHGTYEEGAIDHCDVAVAIFSGHYIDDEHKPRLLKQADRYMYMFAKPDYAPDWYYSQEEQEISKTLTDYDHLHEMFPLIAINNYLVAYKI